MSGLAQDRAKLQYLSRDSIAAASGLLPLRKLMAIISAQLPPAACLKLRVRCSDKSRQMHDHMRDLLMGLELMSPSPG